MVKLLPKEKVILHLKEITFVLYWFILMWSYYSNVDLYLTNKRLIFVLFYGGSRNLPTEITYYFKKQDLEKYKKSSIESLVLSCEEGKGRFLGDFIKFRILKQIDVRVYSNKNKEIKKIVNKYLQS